MAPAPIAATTSALSSSETKPMVTNRGAMMDAVVIRATVEEPWAVLIAAQSIKGSQIPRLALERESARVVAIPLFCNTVPKMPPAPVIRIMLEASTIAFPTHPVVDKISLSHFLGNKKELSLIHI